MSEQHTLVARTHARTQVKPVDNAKVAGNCVAAEDNERTIIREGVAPVVVPRIALHTVAVAEEVDSTTRVPEEEAVLTRELVVGDLDVCCVEGQAYVLKKTKNEKTERKKVQTLLCWIPDVCGCRQNVLVLGSKHISHPHLGAIFNKGCDVII